MSVDYKIETLGKAEIDALWAKIKATFVLKAGDTATGLITMPQLKISDTNSNKHIEFSRQGWNYITVPSTNGILAINVAGTNASATSYAFTGTELRPGSNKAFSLGTASYQWNNIYGYAIYEDGTALASKYAGITLESYFANGILKSDNMPTATSSVLGGVKVGSTLAISSGTLNQKSGICTAGTYRSVTVDTYGRVTAGDNPTTLSGYGITDAKIDNTDVITLGSNTIRGLNDAAQTFAGAKTFSGNIYAPTVYENGTSLSDKYLALTGGTMANTTVVTNLNADLIDGTHLGVFYKHGYAYPAGSSAKPWHLVAQFSQSVASSQINTDVTFYVSEFYSAISYGIINVRARFAVNGTTPEFLTADWSLACNISPSNFVVTYVKSGSTITIRLYCKRSGWTSYGFRKLEEQALGSPSNVWVCHNATGDNYTYASIPSGETQVTSVYRELDVSDLFATNNISLLNNKGIRMRTTETDTPYRTVLTMTTGNEFQVGYSGLNMRVMAARTDFDNPIILANNKSIGWMKSDGTTTLANMISLNTGNVLAIGYAHTSTGETRLHGQSITQYVGTTKIAEVNAIGVTSYGGVAAMGIADLSIN